MGMAWGPTPPRCWGCCRDYGIKKSLLTHICFLCWANGITEWREDQYFHGQGD